MVIFLVAFSVDSFLNRTIMSIAGPEIIREFSLTPTQMGTVYTAFIFSYAIAMIPGGALVDRLGPRWTLSLTGFGSALFTGLTALVGTSGLASRLGTMTSFVLVRMGLGVVNAPLYPASGRMTANWIALPERARVQGAVIAGAGLGGAISPLLYAWSIRCWGWHVSLLLTALGTAVLAAVWHWFARDYPDQWRSRTAYGADSVVREPRLATPWRRLLADRNLLMLSASYFSVGYFEFIFFYWIYYYFGEIRHAGRDQSAIYTTALFITFTILSPLGGRASDYCARVLGRKWGLRLVPLAALTSSAVLLYIGTGAQSNRAVAGLMSIALGLAAASEAAYWTSAIELGAEHAGAAGGILNAGGNIGGFLAPVLTPYIAARAGWSWGLYAGTLVLLAGVVAWFFIDPTRAITPARAEGD
jgi:ACS family glucarate transporter-like MFS transporter